MYLDDSGVIVEATKPTQNAIAIENLDDTYDVNYIKVAHLALSYCMQMYAHTCKQSLKNTNFASS